MAQKKPHSPVPIDGIVKLLKGLIDSQRLAWALLWESRVSFWAKIIWLMTWVYVVSPIDLLPAAVLGPIGVADDLAALAIGTGLFVSSCPPAVVAQKMQQIFGAGHGTRD